MPVIRPMSEADVDAALELTNEAFADLDRRLGEEPAPFPDPATATIRYRDLVRRDPGGSWVAEDEHGLAGCALALLREGVWGLSLLVVRPGLQSGGVGSELLRRAYEYGADARGRIILSSPDPRAIRAYHRLGLALHPAVMATGLTLMFGVMRVINLAHGAFIILGAYMAFFTFQWFRLDPFVELGIDRISRSAGNLMRLSGTGGGSRVSSTAPDRSPPGR